MVSRDPQTVDRASRWERIRRNVWMLASTLISVGILVTSVYAADALGGPRFAGPLVVGFFALDLHVFAWGYDRFDLVAPWQFREATAGDPDAE